MITEFKIRKEILVNTGNYENEKISHEVTFKVNTDPSYGTFDKESIDKYEEEVTERIDQYLKNQVRLIKSSRGR